MSCSPTSRQELLPGRARVIPASGQQLTLLRVLTPVTHSWALCPGPAQTPASSWAPAALPAVEGFLAGGSDYILPCIPLPFEEKLKLLS